MIHEIKHHAINSVEDQTSICHQVVGYKCNFNHFDSANYQPICTALAAASTRTTEEAKNDCENESATFSHATSKLHMRPPKFLETSFLLIFKQ